MSLIDKKGMLESDIQIATDSISDLLSQGEYSRGEVSQFLRENDEIITKWETFDKDKYFKVCHGKDGTIYSVQLYIIHGITRKVIQHLSLRCNRKSCNHIRIVVPEIPKSIAIYEGDKYYKELCEEFKSVGEKAINYRSNSDDYNLIASIEDLVNKVKAVCRKLQSVWDKEVNKKKILKYLDIPDDSPKECELTMTYSRQRYNMWGYKHMDIMKHIQQCIYESKRY